VLQIYWYRVDHLPQICGCHFPNQNNDTVCKRQKLKMALEVTIFSEKFDPTDGCGVDPTDRCGVLFDPTDRCGVLFDPTDTCGVLFDPTHTCRVLFDPTDTCGVLSESQHSGHRIKNTICIKVATLPQNLVRISQIEQYGNSFSKYNIAAAAIFNLFFIPNFSVSQMRSTSESQHSLQIW
jgi:hypothetical protein